jgi:hypothetical protein
MNGQLLGIPMCLWTGCDPDIVADAIAAQEEIDRIRRGEE